MANPSGRPDKKRGPEKSDHRKAAEAAGISRHQMYQALDVARISDEEFERLVEGEDPPTLTELAATGRGRPEKDTAGDTFQMPKSMKAKCCPHCGGALE